MAKNEKSEMTEKFMHTQIQEKQDQLVVFDHSGGSEP